MVGRECVTVGIWCSVGRNSLTSSHSFNLLTQSSVGFRPLYLSLQGSGAHAMDPRSPPPASSGIFIYQLSPFSNLSFSIGSMQSAFKYFFFHLNYKNKTLRCRQPTHPGFSSPSQPNYWKSCDEWIFVEYEWIFILPIPHLPVSPQPTLNWLHSHSFPAAKS